MILRIYHETLGGHVHMRVFIGNREGALGKCGDLTLRVSEFDEFRSRTDAEFRPEISPSHKRDNSNPILEE